MPFSNAVSHYAILTAMLAPALLMTATASLLVSANTRLARVVDRLRGLIIEWRHDAPDRAFREDQIARHRARAQLVLRTCQLLYLAMAAFVGTSLALAADAIIGFKLGALPTVLAVFGVCFLLGASFCMWREVTMSVQSFDKELDQEYARRKPGE
ncbi:DUF2721 domain-containing protein [Lysobacter soyae]|jgi:hypothetical protein|uniref:DUF2721 domain-containing protein n=1 Tax=Lysobacter soyae TaxID=2764185 RepID=A0ABX8WSL9_9GAMM|nr:DUF2721 domain-containing protein [Lysobacter sp. CJ11]QYR53831.1 DUF2721 domain-containing protein [Lysobacter sp. CJ11]